MKDIDKIKQNLTITIVDENGSRQFTLARLAQRLIVYAALTLIALVIAGYFTLNYFIHKFSDINLAKQEAYREYQNAQEQNSFLQDDIQSKSEELAAMRERVADLEKMMNVYAYNAKQNAEIKGDLSALDEGQKDTILQIIPSGNPVNLYEMKQKSSGRAKEAYVLVNSGYTPSSLAQIGYDYYTPISQPVRATADGIVESTRENNQKYGYGNLVRLSHVLGFSSAYTNLANVKVKQGQFVSKGDIIGYTTASAGKNHTSLYYEVRFLSEGLDTLSFIEWDKENFNSIFNADKNANINLDGLIWALNDIVKLNDISSHLADDTGVESKNEGVITSEAKYLKNIESNKQNKDASPLLEQKLSMTNNNADSNKIRNLDSINGDSHITPPFAGGLGGGKADIDSINNTESKTQDSINNKNQAVMTSERSEAKYLKTESNTQKKDASPLLTQKLSMTNNLQNLDSKKDSVMTYFREAKAKYLKTNESQSIESKNADSTIPPPNPPAKGGATTLIDSNKTHNLDSVESANANKDASPLLTQKLSMTTPPSHIAMTTPLQNLKSKK